MKYTLILFIASTLIFNVAISSSSKEVAVDESAPKLYKNGSCEIICYEKTPDCYVTKDDSGCLVISNTKPKRVNGSYICKIESCEIKRVYK